MKVIAFSAVLIIIFAGISPGIVYGTHEKVRVICYKGMGTEEKEIDYSTFNIIKQMADKIRNGGDNREEYIEELRKFLAEKNIIEIPELNIKNGPSWLSNFLCYVVGYGEIITVQPFEIPLLVLVGISMILQSFFPAMEWLTDFLFFNIFGMLSLKLPRFFMPVVYFTTVPYGRFEIDAYGINGGIGYHMYGIMFGFTGIKLLYGDENFKEILMFGTCLAISGPDS